MYRQTDCENPRELAGFCKKSFAMYYNGGEIWFEHLDGIYGFSELVAEKLSEDYHAFKAPSKPSLMAVNVDETNVTEALVEDMKKYFINGGKHFTRVAVVGADGATKRRMKKAFLGGGFALKFFSDFEKSKQWLTSEEM